MSTHPRSQIYYWKCDRPAAFHGTDERPRDEAAITGPLMEALRSTFPGIAITMRPAPSQGNHLTFVATMDGKDRFVRVEDGPEGDDYMAVESRVMTAVREMGVPTPVIHAVDASRKSVPFAWQVMDQVPFPDLNKHHQAGTLDLPTIAEAAGAAVARWQALSVTGFGPFDPQCTSNLKGFHASYANYFHQHLERHLHFLVDEKFLPRDVAEEISRVIERHHLLLLLDQGCLVHKDLALWNILGSETKIAAFIDFDDAIAGDPMDDLSLLACFHDSPTIERALEGYASVRPLPEHHERRLALHLLRNMIVKAVIRVGAGYFDRKEGFFLNGNGKDLRTVTHEKLNVAMEALQK